MQFIRIDADNGAVLFVHASDLKDIFPSQEYIVIELVPIGYYISIVPMERIYMVKVTKSSLPPTSAPGTWRLGLATGGVQLGRQHRPARLQSS